MTLSRSTVEPGGAVTIEGSNWSASADTPNDPAPAAWTSVDLDFSQGALQDSVGTVLLRDGAFAATVTLPTSAQSGEAIVRVTSSGFSTGVTIEVGGG